MAGAESPVVPDRPEAQRFPMDIRRLERTSAGEAPSQGFPLARWPPAPTLEILPRLAPPRFGISHRSLFTASITPSAYSLLTSFA